MLTNVWSWMTQNINFIFALIFFVASVVLFVIKLKKNRGNIVDVFSLLMIGCIFVSSCFIMFLSQPENAGVTAPKWIITLHASLRLFFADGNAVFNTGDKALDKLYQISYYVLAFWAPLSLVGAVISYFNNSLNIFKIKHFYRSRNIIVFNELNEKNLAIAQNFKSVSKHSYGVYDKKFPNAFFNSDYFYSLERKRKIFIFCDVYKEDTERSHELIEQANELGYFLLKDDIVTLHKKIQKTLKATARRKLIRYFLSGADENENIRHAVEIADMVGKKPIKNLAVFAFAEGDANGHIIEALNTSAEFFFERLSPSLLMAIDVLTKEENRLIAPATESATQDVEKNLKVLILGLGSYGFEIGKFLSWYYQRLTGNIKIYFVDAATNMLSSLKGSYSDFINYRPTLGAPEQNACFELAFYEGVDVFSDKFTKVLKNIYDEEGPGLKKGLDAVFCVLGDDNKNIEAAFHLRKLLDRINHEALFKINMDVIKECAEGKDKESTVAADNCNDGFCCEAYEYQNGKLIDKIRIFSIVHNDKIKANFTNSNGFIKDCHIEFVGEDSSTYGYTNIFDVELEQLAVTRGRAQNNGEETIRKNIIKHNSKEYYRNSSLAERLYEKFIETIYPTKENDEKYDELRCKIGNKRWNAYMLSIGRTCFDVDRKYAETIFDMRNKIKILPVRQWERGMWHNSIIPYNALPSAEQENNYKKPNKGE